jgi:hypothetical protein
VRRIRGEIAFPTEAFFKPIKCFVDCQHEWADLVGDTFRGQPNIGACRTDATGMIRCFYEGLHGAAENEPINREQQHQDWSRDPDGALKKTGNHIVDQGIPVLEVFGDLNPDRLAGNVFSETGAGDYTLS